jgi:hypothetical protein
MTEFFRPGPTGFAGVMQVNPGTRLLMASSSPAVCGSDTTYAARFEHEIRSLQSTLATSGTFAMNDAHVRNLYNQRVKAAANEIRSAAQSGSISWKLAASQASELRNTVMETLRVRTSPYGRASAQGMKAQGKSINALIAEKTIKLFGSNADFSRLNTAQQNQVFAAVVESSGKTNAGVNAAMSRMRAAGRTLIFLSIAISVYNVSVAEDKAAAAGMELAITGASIAGGAAGGALAGLACGPGAPACVVIGAFVGGALAAFGVSSLW